MPPNLTDKLVQVEQDLQATMQRQHDTLALAQALGERIAFLRGQHALLMELQPDEPLSPSQVPPQA